MSGEKRDEEAAGGTRENLKKKRELEEARKSGLIPAEKDEEGREINPHIPQYIAKAPWYLHNEGPSLKHQRLSEHADSAEVVAKIEKWYTHGLKEEKTSRKRFKPGSCTNCGATTHKAIDCVERPRQKGARYTGKDLAPDEYLPTESITDFEAKRDRWGGYDPASFDLIVEEYDDTVKEQQRRRDKNNATSSPHHSRPDSSNSSDDDDEAKIRDFDTSNAPIGTKDDRTRTTTRNLRIREDTAKYLINLNLDSAFYDPKTRSMREDPTAQLPQDLKEKLLYRGDNATRNTGEADMPKRMEVFAWEAYTKGKTIHSQTNPTALALEFSIHQKAKQAAAKEKRNNLVQKYGGAEHLRVPDDVRQAQDERYILYDETGEGQLMGQQRPAVKSMYEEDVYPLDHSSVWGSWWCIETSKWGYSCCHKTDQSKSCS